MKICIALVCLSFYLTVASAGRCLEQGECSETQCCSGLPFFGGICRALSPQGSKCKVVDKIIPIFGDFYIGGSCPCGEGLVCVQQGKKKNSGVCLPPPPPPPPPPTANPPPPPPPTTAEPEEPISNKDESKESDESVSSEESKSSQESKSSEESVSEESKSSEESVSEESKPSEKSASVEPEDVSVSEESASVEPEVPAENPAEALE
jgi:hypothetical protein